MRTQTGPVFLLIEASLAVVLPNLSVNQSCHARHWTNHRFVDTFNSSNELGRLQPSLDTLTINETIERYKKNKPKSADGRSHLSGHVGIYSGQNLAARP